MDQSHRNLVIENIGFYDSGWTYSEIENLILAMWVVVELNHVLCNSAHRETDPWANVGISSFPLSAEDDSN